MKKTIAVILIVLASYTVIQGVKGIYDSIKYKEMTCEQIFASNRSIEHIPVKCLIIKSREK